MTTIVITEHQSHWECRWGSETHRAATAAEALAYVRRRGDRLARGSAAGMAIQVVEWATTTSIGEQVVRALQD